MLTVKNSTETTGFVASSLMGPNSVPPEVASKMLEQSRKAYATKEERAAADAELVATFPPRMAKELASLNVKLPSEIVNVCIDFGSFLFDVYSLSANRPQAPLALAAHNSRLQRLAERLEGKTFDLSQDELAVIKKALENDDLWKTLVLHGYYESTDAEGKVVKNSLAINATGAQYFTKTLDAAVKLFEAENAKPSDNAQKSEVKTKAGKPKAG